jgi:hypothetical protein
MPTEKQQARQNPTATPMPRKPARKSAPKASAKPAKPKPKPQLAARAARPAALTAGGKRAIVRGCIAACAGSSNFGPNTQLNNIPADAQCVQVCVIERTGEPINVAGSDTENSIVAKL